MATLREISYDILSIARDSKISESESLNLRQIESWVIQYRAKYIKQDIDKGKYINPDYVQSLKCIEVEDVDYSVDTNLESGCKLLRTTQTLPSSIDFNYMSGLIYIGTITGEQIELVPANRGYWQKYKKYANNKPIAYLKDRYLYIQNNTLIKYITVRGIFENPLDATNFYDSCANQQCYIVDSIFPFPVNKLPTLKQEILTKEMRLEIEFPTDVKNDSQDKLS